MDVRYLLEQAFATFDRTTHPCAPPALHLLARAAYPDLKVDAAILRFATDHTLLPYYFAFAPEALTQAYRNRLALASHATQIQLLRARLNCSDLPPTLRLCPECIHADMEDFGVPYWHRSHQLPGVSICPLHDAALLLSTCSCQSVITKLQAPPARGNDQLAPSSMPLDSATVQRVAHMSLECLQEWQPARYCLYRETRGINSRGRRPLGLTVDEELVNRVETHFVRWLSDHGGEENSFGPPGWWQLRQSQTGRPLTTLQTILVRLFIEDAHAAP